MTGSRWAEDEVVHQPFYTRVLRLRHLAPSGLLCFVFLEGAIALGFLLALAELVSWWGVIVLPVTVALMVKLNDVVAGALARPATAAPPVAARAAVLRPATTALLGEEATTRLPGINSSGRPVRRPWAERLDVHQQQARQSAARRYE
jgi:hypothetical protein